MTGTEMAAWYRRAKAKIEECKITAQAMDGANYCDFEEYQYAQAICDFCELIMMLPASSNSDISALITEVEVEVGETSCEHGVEIGAHCLFCWDEAG